MEMHFNGMITSGIWFGAHSQCWMGHGQINRSLGLLYRVGTWEGRSAIDLCMKWLHVLRVVLQSPVVAKIYTTHCSYRSFVRTFHHSNTLTSVQSKTFVNGHSHTRFVMHVGIANPRWRGIRSRHSWRMRTLQCYVSGKRPRDNYISH